MDIRFARSPRSTIGVEWELPLIDRDTDDLAARAPAVISAARKRLGDEDRVTHELLTNTAEVVSSVHRTVGEATGELRRIVDAVIEAADDVEADVMCAGAHPFAAPPQQEVTPDSERYSTLIDRTKWWGRQLLIWGVHVHVGIDDRDRALPVMNAMRSYIPHLQALTASSPFWGGVDTEYASNRALLFQQIPTAGLPPQAASWDDFTAIVDDLRTTGVIDDVSELRWDLRPSPKWGTIENRVSDGISTLPELGAIVALVQCLVTESLERLDAGHEPETLQPWFVYENKWRAARYGLDAEIITSRDGHQALVGDDIRDLIVRLEPIADRLTCQPELYALEDILTAGASYQRQRRVAAEHDGDLRAVVRSLVGELRDSI